MAGKVAMIASTTALISGTTTFTTNWAKNMPKRTSKVFPRGSIANCTSSFGSSMTMQTTGLPDSIDANTGATLGGGIIAPMAMVRDTTTERPSHSL